METVRKICNLATNGVNSMSDVFLLFLIFLMLAYTFWDELFTR